MGKHILEAKNLVAGYDGNAIIKGLNLIIPEGKISVIIGSNGCGKAARNKWESNRNANGKRPFSRVCRCSFLVCEARVYHL